VPLIPRRLGGDTVRRLLFISLVLSGCGGNGGTDVVLPALTIRTSTAGVEPDPDGYNVQVDGLAVQQIGAAAMVTVDRLSEGPHTVTLSGVAPNCAVEGENPKAVTVTHGATASVAFTVTCGAAMGAIEVSTATSGPGTDPDGYALVLDGGDRGPVGLNATTILGAIQAGPRSVGLAALAANCQVSGENPRTVTVVAGETVQVAFAVTCGVPGPTIGSLEISVSTTGPEQDSDGYRVTMDGAASQPIGTNAIITLANVSAVQHTVQLGELAPNCAVQGENPIGAAVPAGGTVRVSFTVRCVATTGELTVTVSGLPSGIPAAITVRGPSDYSQAVTETRTLTGLAPGSYTVGASNVVSGSTAYTASVSRPTVDVAAGATTDVTVGYTAEAKVTLNLRIDGLYITQSTQTYASDVPLVAGREAYLRVFVVANESNSARPSVRVRLSRPGAPAWTRTISAPRSSTPTEVQEGTLNQSWNLPIPASQIQSGLSIVAEVDQSEGVEESDDGDNRFPAAGTKSLLVRAVPAARMRFVSVQQGSSPPGNVSDANKDRLMELARRIHPLNAVDTDVRPAVFTFSGTLEANGNGWGQLVSDLDALRVTEGTNRTYYGVVNVPYGREGLVGLTLGQGVPTAAGWDDPDDASRVVAHELGHTWGRRHSPCGIFGESVDPLYPYANGRIGVFGFDVAARSLEPQSAPDIMGYCFENPWISDYTYQGVMAYRESSSTTAANATPSQPSLLIWGHIVNGHPVLEPAFQVVTRPSLPRRPGPYSVTATALDGTQLFALSFDAATPADSPEGGSYFAFAVPLDPARATRLASLRLAGPGGITAALRALPDLRMGAQETIAARREGQNVLLQWNPSVHPTIMVRDPDTGEVLSFARGGSARVRTSKGEVDLVLSDGVQSQRLRKAISRP